MIELYDIARSTISDELCRVICITMPYVVVRYQTSPGKPMLRLYKDFELVKKYEGKKTT